MLFAVFFAYSSYYWWRAFPYNEFGGMRMTNYSVLRNAVPLDEAAERYGTVRRGFMFFLELGASEAERRRSKLSRRPRG